GNHFHGLTGSTIHNFVVTSSASSGDALSFGIDSTVSGNTFSQLAIAHTMNAINLYGGTSNNKFTGNLLLGSATLNCVLSGAGSSPGLNATTCTANGVSDFNYLPGLNLSLDTFVGP